MKKLKIFLIFILSFFVIHFGYAADTKPDVQIWQSLLTKHIKVVNHGRANQVDYAGFARDHVRLSLYLKQLSNVSKKQFSRWSEKQQLAFFINAYNAWTINYVLTKWPDIHSIKELGGVFSSPWSKKFIPLLGKTISLDDLEHQLIRKNYQEPRVHFALNCASIGCPSLRAEAYQADKLDQQLEQQVRLFLSDHSRNYVQGTTLILSPIFKWYATDFIHGKQTLTTFLIKYINVLPLNEEQKNILLHNKIHISYGDYDWGLNVVQP